MRDWLAWVLIRMARRLTTLGEVDDLLAQIEPKQRWAAFEQR